MDEQLAAINWTSDATNAEHDAVQYSFSAPEIVYDSSSGSLNQDSASVNLDIDDQKASPTWQNAESISLQQHELDSSIQKLAGDVPGLDVDNLYIFCIKNLIHKNYLLVSVCYVNTHFQVLVFLLE